MTAPRWAGAARPGRPLPRRDPRSAPGAGASVRPELRVVPDLGARRRRRRTRLLTTVAGAAVVVGLFAIVCLHVLLSQGQMELDRLEARAAELRSRNERLGVQVAELESPTRVVAVAEDKLGMAPPTSVVPLGGPPTTAAANR